MNELIEPTTQTFQSLVLTNDQQNALNAFVGFLMNPIETVFVLQGYAGCGKSTLVKELINQLPKLMDTARLINPKHPDYEVVLTATTNKAAEALSGILKEPVITIHSALSLRVVTDFKTNKSELVPRKNEALHTKLLFIDEASYVDKELLGYIFSLTKDCKIIFIGDPAQLTPVMSSDVPVFNANFTGAALTEVVRQPQLPNGGIHPITALATQFRETVNTGKFFSFVPDGQYVQYMGEADFKAALMNEFNRLDWKYADSKVLAWTNKTVTRYNHYIRENVKGEPQLQAGDYAVCNSFIQLGSGRSIKTDQLVQITKDQNTINSHGVMGRVLIIDNAHQVFLANNLQEAKKRMKMAQVNEEWEELRDMTNNWIDLRAAFACTVNKSQGSTFDKVFIDLDDIRRCNSGDQIARMLYVAVSRARHQVVFTGDIA